MNRGDLVGLLLGLDLPEHEPIASGPRTDHVDERTTAGLLEGSAQRLAVDGHDFSVREPCQRQGPLAKCLRQRLRVKGGEDPPKRVVRGNPVTQVQKCSQPFLPGAPKGFDGAERIRSTDHRTERQNQDVHQ